MEDFVTRFSKRRTNFEEFSQILDDVIAEEGDDTVTPWIPSRDNEFWESLDRIYAAGLNKDTTKVPWLASFTQIDDLGPMGRDMFMAFAALESLQEMPEETFQEGKRLWSEISINASQYRKVGVCKVLEASAYHEAIPLLRRMAEDESGYVRSEAQWMIRSLIEKFGNPNENR